MTRPVAQLPALCVAISLFASRGLLAADRPCLAAGVVASGALEQRFPSLVARVRDEVITRSRDDGGFCAQIELGLREDSSIRLEVTLPDGRSAARAAAGQEDVIPILRALLLVPARSSDAASEPPPGGTASRGGGSTPDKRPSARATQAAARAEEFKSSDELVVTTSQPSSGVGVELSLLTGSRIGDGQASIAFGAMSFLDLGGWLIGFEARADRYYLLLDGDPDIALELGLLFGKRLHFTDIALDVVAGPGFAMKGAVSDQEVVAVNMPPAEPPPPTPERNSGTVPRLLAGARLGFNPRAVFRTFIGLDGTYGATAGALTGQDSPHLPEWTVGVSLGATVGTR